MRFFFLARYGVALFLAALAAHIASAASDKPNIIHIFADDLGFGSVGFNGQTKILTPKLDALAAGGMRLTNAYSSSVCAASRSMLYTGFHQGHGNVDGNSELEQGFRADEVMTPQVLAAAGYKSAVFGKWGFGADGSRNLTGSDPVPSITAPGSLPNVHGFSTFYGYLNHGAAQDYFYDWMWQTDANAPQGVSLVANNGGAGGSAQYTHDLFATKSEQYVTAHAGDATPFYMQVDYTIPHFDIDAIASVANGLNPYSAQPWTTKQKEYAAMITRMDASIGSLMDTLDDPNHDGNHSDSIRNNTLIIFTSDNGPSTEDTNPAPEVTPYEFFNANGQYRGGKFEIYEGGIHMPTVAYWPGTIQPGTQSNYRTDLTDFMATAADLAGVEAPVGIDGTSIAPILTGEGHMRERDYLVFEHQGAHGNDADPRVGRWAVVRQDGMKLIRYDNETSELFNLVADPGEAAPLNLSLPANAQIASELEADAIAEDVTKGTVQYRTWSGPNGGALQDARHWGAPTGPDGYWSAVVANTGASPTIAHVSANVTTLGVEVRGQTALQAVNVHAGKTLTGRNEVRVGPHGRIDLDGGTLATNRWVNVRAGGEVAGQGTIAGDVYNEGKLSPGSQDATAWPVAAPPALPPIGLNTGVVTAAAFNFAGVQDDVPVEQTSTLSPYLELSQGLDFGPGVGPRWGSGGTDAGNELNTIGHTAASLTQAIANGDYAGFTVNSVAGAGVVPNTVSFQVWRNGGAAAKNFAIVSSIGNVVSTLVQATYSDTGSGNQHTLTATLPVIVDALTGPLEYRLYAWGATATTGNTHIDAASLTGRFVAVPTLEFNFAGVQDQSPLTALKRQDANLTLTSGLHFGPGVGPRGAGGGNNAGSEFNVAGFSTGSTLQSAIDGGDYLSFSVQSVAGMAMFTDSVSFSLWRQAAGSASNYAIMSSVGGFADGQQIAQIQQLATGASNTTSFIGSFSNAQPTTAPVEFRLYGWNAATSLDNTHVVAASMRARFASVVGTPIDPTGQLTVQGDFYHLDGGMLSIDLGGKTAGVSYDQLSVSGKVDLEGDLQVSLVDSGNGNPFAPALGDSFQILTATGGVVGAFAHATLPTLPSDLDWFIKYLPNSVALTVLSSADFNRDGTVDGADLTLWKAGAGLTAGAIKINGDANGDGAVDGGDYLLWQRQFGLTVAAAQSALNRVPEPNGPVMWIVLFSLTMWSTRRQAAGQKSMSLG